MTGTVVLFLALGAGLVVSGRRRLAVVVVLPFLAVLVVQTWHIAAGYGVSPPRSVNKFPDLIGYYIVQLIFLGLALGAADQVRKYKSHRTGLAPKPRSAARDTWIGLVVNGGLSAAVVLGFLLDRPLFDPGSVVHHTANGSPPVFGVLGGLLCAIVFAGLGPRSLFRTRRCARAGVARSVGPDTTISLDASSGAVR